MAKIKSNKIHKYTDVEDHIEQLMVINDDLSKKKLKKDFISCFNTLNNRARYKFFWDVETVTHEKFLLFFILLKKICKEHGYKKHITDDELETLLTNLLPMNKGAISMYMIAKLFNVKRPLLIPISLPFDHIDPERYRTYMAQLDDYDLRNAEWNLIQVHKLEEKGKIKKHKKTHKKKPIKPLYKYDIFTAWNDLD